MSEREKLQQEETVDTVKEQTPDTDSEVEEVKDPAGEKPCPEELADEACDAKADGAKTADAKDTAPGEDRLTPDSEEAGEEEPWSCPDYEQAYQDIYDEILNRFRSFSPSDEIASKITEEHITEYLEGSREERTQQFKEGREKRFLSALEVLAGLAAVILIVYFLADNPAILVNILYIIGALAALWIWKSSRDKDR